MHLDPRQLAESTAQLRGERLHALGDRLETDRQRVVGSDTQADLAGVVGLPVLEPASVVADPVAAVRQPLGRVQVEQRRLELLDQAPPHPEEARAARAAQELPAGGRQHVTAESVDIDRQLSDRLARIQQQGHAGRARQPADLRHRIDQPAMRGCMDERDELHALVEHPLERGDVELPMLVVGHDLDDGAGSCRDLLAARSSSTRTQPSREDPVTGGEPERVERHVPRPGRVLDDRDLSRVPPTSRASASYVCSQASRRSAAAS